MTDDPWADRDDQRRSLRRALRPDLPAYERARGLKIRYEVRASELRCGRVDTYVKRCKLYASALRQAWEDMGGGYDVELIDLETGESLEIPYSADPIEAPEVDPDVEPEEVWVEAGLQRGRE